jgi:competence protein ComEA
MKKWRYYLLVPTLVIGVFSSGMAWSQNTPAGSTAPTAPTSAAKPAMAGTPKPAAKININTADEATLMTLKNIGKSKASAIIDYRQKNGPFKSVDDLTKVKGIGDKTLAQLKDQLTIE